LPALEQLHLQRPGEALDVLARPGGEGIDVERVLARDRARADELVVGSHGQPFKKSSCQRMPANGIQR